MEEVKMTRILVVEDEKVIRELLRDNFEFEGFAVEEAPDLATADQKLSPHRSGEFPDLIMLDVNLPDGDGVTRLKGWREGKFGKQLVTPVIVCTVKDREIDVVRALDAGADDYVTKPFRIRELLARVRAVLRRGRNDESERGPGDATKSTSLSSRVDAEAGGRQKNRVGPWTVDTGGRRVTLESGQEAMLTATEWSFLELFLRNRGQVLSRDQIVEAVWNVRELEDSRAVDVHLGRLRRKLDTPGGAEIITTVRGLGYRLEEDRE